MQEYDVDAKTNLVHDDELTYNLDGSLSMCVSEEYLRPRTAIS